MQAFNGLVMLVSSLSRLFAQYGVDLERVEQRLRVSEVRGIEALAEATVHSGE
jgi:hypothetical protein